MVKIIHTSDVHLSSDYPERVEALEKVLDFAEENNADLVTIGGDTFDSELQAEKLRSELRDIFSGQSYDILVIPGNHDKEAFREDLFFGDNFKSIIEKPFEEIIIDDGNVKIIGLPYTPYPEEELLLALKEREKFEGTEILLLHCTLGFHYFNQSVGSEEEKSYFPISKNLLSDLSFDYYLSGHFHNSNKVRISKNSTFVYPGTPASVNSNETGPRYVATLDTVEDEISLKTIDTFHYDILEMDVLPGEEEKALKKIEEWTNEKIDKNVDLSIIVNGHITMDESKFNHSLLKASQDISVKNRTSTVDKIVNHPLYKSFEEKLKKMDIEDRGFEREIRKRTLKVFSELSSRGKIT